MRSKTKRLAEAFHKRDIDGGRKGGYLRGQAAKNLRTIRRTDGRAAAVRTVLATVTKRNKNWRRNIPLSVS